MSIYDSLGIKTRINAAACYTALGGSIMPVEVVAAMSDAAKSFISLHELQEKAGARIAQLTKNEGAFITTGAAAGIVLSILACRTRGDLVEIQKIIDGNSKRSEVIMFAGQRIPYDSNIRVAGSELVTVGDAIQSFDYQLEAKINEFTSAIFFCAGAHLASAALTLEKTIEIAAKYSVPVIVDAAAQLPPASNLWRFTNELGADLAIFSGGKALRGPQSSGLVVGRKEFIEAIRVNAAPYPRLGRGFKASKEEIAGLLTALELYLKRDHEADWQRWSKVVDSWVGVLTSKSSCTIWRDDVNEAGQPTPRVAIQLKEPTALDVIAKLQSLDPIVEVVHDSRRMVWISPDSLQPGEEEKVPTQLLKALPY
ncbi:MAG: aminotransferase class V-fold PLP-dependent enzyme [Actinobacteria bacterium]|nr:aminotransferase class V-fold PLP-dependent enzyme [Actinomycetota bacterium]